MVELGNHKTKDLCNSAKGFSCTLHEEVTVTFLSF